MRKSPFGSYKSRRVLFFTNFTFSLVPGHKVLKKCDLPYSIAVKSYGTFFEIGFKKCGLIVQKSFSEKKIFRN